MLDARRPGDPDAIRRRTEAADATGLIAGKATILDIILLDQVAYGLHPRINAGAIDCLRRQHVPRLRRIARTAPEEWGVAHKPTDPAEVEVLGLQTAQTSIEGLSDLPARL